MQGTRRAEAEIARRVEDIFGLVVDGQPMRVIRQFVAESCDWDAPERTMWRYKKRATDLIVVRSAEVCETVLATAVNRLERLYGRALQRGDLRTALAVQQEIARLHGLNAPTKTELTGAGGAPLIAAEADMAARFDELVEAQAARLEKAPKKR